LTLQESRGFATILLIPLVALLPLPLLLLLLTGLVASEDGSLCVSISQDRSVKVFDVLGFRPDHDDEAAIHPGVAEWTYKVRGQWFDTASQVQVFSGKARVQLASCALLIHKADSATG